MKNLNEMKAKELKELAKGLKIKDWWNKSKAQLIADIEAVEEVTTVVEDDSDKILEPKRGQVINYKGKSLALCAWARELGLPVQTLYGRLFNRKWTVEKAFTYDRNKKAE